VLDGSTDRANIEPYANEVAGQTWFGKHKNMLYSEAPRDSGCAQIETHWNERKACSGAFAAKIVRSH
jgi:hypothetical protein